LRFTGLDVVWLKLPVATLGSGAVNFCQICQTLRVTPAMEAGLADHVWEIEDPVNLSG